MKVYVLQNKELNLSLNKQAVDFKAKYGQRYAVYEVDTKVCNLQPEVATDPYQEQFCTDLWSQVEKSFGRTGNGPPNAKIPRKEKSDEGSGSPRVRSIKISLGIYSQHYSQPEQQPPSIVEIDGEFFDNLQKLYSKFKSISVKVSMTDFLNCETVYYDVPSNSQTVSHSAVITSTSEIKIDADYIAGNGFSTFLPVPFPVVKHWLGYDDGGKNRLAKLIGGKFTIEINIITLEAYRPTPGFQNRLILDKGYFSDVTIISSDGKEFPAHKCFLAVYSPVLQAELEGSSKIEMVDMSEEGVKAFLTFLYYEKVDQVKNDCSMALRLWKAGEKYEISALQRSMEEVFLKLDNKLWSVEVALQTFILVNDLPVVADELKKRLVELMRCYWASWKTSDYFQRLSRENPTAYIQIIDTIFKYLC